MQFKIILSIKKKRRQNKKKIKMYCLQIKAKLWICHEEMKDIPDFWT